jgi:hypothetical protein
MAKAGVDGTTLRQTARQALELIPRADAPYVRR